MKSKIFLLTIGILSFFLISSVCFASPGVDKVPVTKELVNKVSDIPVLKVITPTIYTSKVVDVRHSAKLTTILNYEVYLESYEKPPLIELTTRCRVNSKLSRVINNSSSFS